MENRGERPFLNEAKARLASHSWLLAVVAAGSLGQDSQPPSLVPSTTLSHIAYAETSPNPITYETPQHPSVPDSVIAAMKKYPTIFEKEDCEDLKMYYPIYIAAANKYGIDPKILWIFHQEETSSSRDPLTDTRRTVRDYDEKGRVILQNTVEGAMQIDTNFYGPDYVAEAIKGLEHLRQIKIRSPKDAEWIATAARKISEDLKKTKGSLSEAFKNYAAHPVAKRRWEKYNWRFQMLPSFQS